MLTSSGTPLPGRRLLAVSLTGLVVYLALAGALSPGFLAGSWAGRRVTGFVDRRFRPLVLAIASASAVTIVARTLLQSGTVSP